MLDIRSDTKAINIKIKKGTKLLFIKYVNVVG